jgi:hypothetical protein
VMLAKVPCARWNFVEDLLVALAPHPPKNSYIANYLIRNTVTGDIPEGCSQGHIRDVNSNKGKITSHVHTSVVCKLVSSSPVKL